MHHKLLLRMAATCALLWCAVALGQNANVPNSSAQKTTPSSIDGQWTVTFTIQGQSVSGLMNFQAHGEKLGGKLETEHTGPGTLNGGTWSHNKISGIYVFQSHEAVAIAGELREGKLAGVFRTEGLNGKWEAVPASAQP